MNQAQQPLVQTAPLVLLVHTPTWTIWLPPAWQQAPLSGTRSERTVRRG